MGIPLGKNHGNQPDPEPTEDEIKAVDSYCSNNYSFMYNRGYVLTPERIVGYIASQSLYHLEDELKKDNRFVNSSSGTFFFFLIFGLLLFQKDSTIIK